MTLDELLEESFEDPPPPALIPRTEDLRETYARQSREALEMVRKAGLPTP